ncbi:MAG: T9SS type A sorting domain-containing protein [Saprospiraceae bacterium]
MNNKTFTFRKKIDLVTSFWVMVLTFIFSIGTTQAQPLTCNSSVNITLDENCQATVGADQILEGTYSNYNIFTVTFTNSGLPATLNSSHIGQTLSVTVIGPTNSCSGLILVEDKLSPTISCQDVILACNDPLPGPITAFDACGPATVTFQDQVQDNQCNGLFQTVITRTHTAVDGSGNVATCVQTISIQRGTLSDVGYPANIEIDCQDSSDPVFTGTPTGTTCFNLDYTYEDQVIAICGESKKILREWTVSDWCASSIETHTQIIKLLDTTGPTMQQLNDISVGTTSNTCAGNVNLPAIGLSDDCSGGSFDVYIQTPLGTINGNGGLLLDAPLGNHTITYFATDACGNQSSYSLTLTVADNIAPIAICDIHTVVALGFDGTALSDAMTFDDGSWDNCGIVEYKVRRMDNPNCPGNDATPFADNVPFSCCDLGDDVMVELRVKDAAGNVNSCMVEVEVQDKLLPIVTCPADITIFCDDDYEDLTLTGEGTGADNCGNATITYNDINVNIGCGGAGEVTRVWTATDAEGQTASCIQKIFLENDEPFYINPNNENDPTDDIDWPVDYTGTTCGAGLQPSDLPSPYDRPILHEDACDFIAVGYTDTDLEIQAPGCVKILRKWHVMDWCQAGPNTDPTLPGPGVWHYTQVIKINNSSAPVINVCNIPSEVGNYEADCGATLATFNIEASDDCTAEADLEITWEFSNGISGNGAEASGNFNNGSYSLTFTVSDGCGNFTHCENDFIVKDAKKPTPICILGLATVVMPSSGDVKIWATDFESGSSYDNCSGYPNLKFSFSSDVNQDSLVITCADITANGIYPVEIWVTDEAGNQDFCSTLISVQDPNGACGLPTALSIFGEVATENQEKVEDVTVQLTGAGLPPMITEMGGNYIFTPLEPGGNYSVTPEKDMNYLNGVTTYDLVLISKHILGLELLDSPYQLIAADANHSESVTTLDIVKLRALILHIDTTLENNTSWRFVKSDFVFDNPANPFQATFPETAEFENLTASAQADFVGIKIGDVNGSASPNNLLGSDTRTFDGTLIFNLENKKVRVGEMFNLDFKAKDFNAIGYQFALNFKDLMLLDVESKLENLSEDNFGFTKMDDGILTTSWNNSSAVKVADDEVLFSLKFLANKNVQLSEALTLTNRYTTAEAYSNQSELLEVKLNYTGGTVNASAFVLFQNTPNPFKDETAIGFNLPEASSVNLKIFDATGRILKLIEGDFAKGYHEVNIKNNELNGTGILYYQIETNNNIATKKMILVD